jgi:predicted acyl esterase
VTLKRVCKTAAAWALPFLLGTVMASAQQKPAAEEPSIDMQWAVKIPARDGVKLNATVFTPHNQKGPLPVIFTSTPCIGDSCTDRAVYFAKHGYVYALVDVRGRGNSGGEFEPFVNEGKDGYDVVEWLAKQPYCNGKVTMWGGSYAGFDQWTVLKEFPPHLATIVPGGSGAPGSGFSVPVQHFWTIRHAIAHFYQRRNGQQQPFWEQRLLGGEIARDVHGALGVSGLRQTSWESLGRLSEVGEAPNG